MAIDIERELNRSQADAVLYTDGPQMVIAGAGSGKTRVLTYRIAHLLEMGVEPWSILALTFTNKAAGEMKERIARQVGADRARYLWMGTFHSIFSRILRSEAESIGYTHNFTIYDQTDSQNLIRTIIKEMQLDDKVYKPGVVQNRISNAKNRLVTASDYMQNGDILLNDKHRNIGLCGQIYQKYSSRCRQADAMDFDDLLLNTYLLFRDNESVRQRYAGQFRYVLVDEYQDTNFAQHNIVWQLTRDNRQVCVVGDDAQSIYSFRGANIDNMLKFTKLYPEARMFKLEQNYRSTQTIVNAANSLIEKNRNQIRKQVFSENEVGDLIKVTRTHSDKEESESVVNRLLDLHTFNNVPWNEIAVLYRTNAQSRVLEESLRSRGLPYRIYGSLSFYQRKEIKDVIAYFRLTVNPNDEEAFKRIINYPARGIGQTTVGKIANAAVMNGASLWNVASDPDYYGLDVNAGTKAKLTAFTGLIRTFMESVGTADASTLAESIVAAAGIKADLDADRTVEGEGRRQNVGELMSGISSFCKDRQEEGDDRIRMVDYLNNVSLMTDQDNDADDDVEKVTLMTVHAAKGLEFDAVCICGLEENLFPSDMSTEDERQIEEERRLMYVAMTRARKYLYLFHAMTRFRYGNVDCCQPSRFLKDIDGKYLSMPASEMRQIWDGRGSFSGGMYDAGDSRPVFRPRQQYNGTRGNNTHDNGGRTFRPRESEGSVSDNREYIGRDSAGREFQRKPELGKTTRKPWQSGNFQVVTDKMLEAAAPSQGSGALHVDNVIEHERFGVGRVLSVEGSGDNAKARIKFLNVGEKTLLLKFARYKVLK